MTVRSATNLPGFQSPASLGIDLLVSVVPISQMHGCRSIKGFALHFLETRRASHSLEKGSQNTEKQRGARRYKNERRTSIPHSPGENSCRQETTPANRQSIITVILQPHAATRTRKTVTLRNLGRVNDCTAS